jgi:hypothetical protein
MRTRPAIRNWKMCCARMEALRCLRRRGMLSRQPYGGML